MLWSALDVVLFVFLGVGYVGHCFVLFVFGTDV